MRGAPAGRSIFRCLKIEHLTKLLERSTRPYHDRIRRFGCCLRLMIDNTDHIRNEQQVSGYRKAVLSNLIRIRDDPKVPENAVSICACRDL